MHPIFHIGRLKEVLAIGDRLVFVFDEEFVRLKDLSIYVLYEPIMEMIIENEPLETYYFLDG